MCIYMHNYPCVPNSLCVQCFLFHGRCVFSLCVYTCTTIPVCLIACVFSIFLFHGRCVFSVCVYTYTTVPVCLIACVFSVFLFHGRCVFSVCVYTCTTIPVCLIACVFSIFLFHGRCVFSVCVYTVLISQNGADFSSWLACVNAGQPVISPGASPAKQAQNWLRPAHEMGSSPHTVRARKIYPPKSYLGLHPVYCVAANMDAVNNVSSRRAGQACSGQDRARSA